MSDSDSEDVDPGSEGDKDPEKGGKLQRQRAQVRDRKDEEGNGKSEKESKQTKKDWLRPRNPKSADADQGAEDYGQYQDTAGDIGDPKNPIDLISSSDEASKPKRKGKAKGRKPPNKRESDKEDGPPGEPSKSKRIRGKKEEPPSLSAKAGAAHAEKAEDGRTEDQANMTPSDLRVAWQELITWLMGRGVSKKTVKDCQDLMKRAVAVVAGCGTAVRPPPVEERKTSRAILGHLQKLVSNAEQELIRREEQEYLERVADREDMPQAAKNIGFCDANGHNPLPGEFVFLESIGSGGYGQAGLWVEYDDYGGIVQRLVLKETYTIEANWNAPFIWEGNINDRYPLEVSVHSRLSDIDKDATCIVRFLAHAVYVRKQMYRTYCEYCPHGDLNNLREEHEKLKETWRSIGKPSEFHIPAIALWAVFENLVQALFVLWHGHSPEEDAPPRPVRIIHKDIKPHNIFLGPLDKEKWPFMPKPKLGDFGLAAPEDNPASQRRLGTIDYQAPEQVEYVDVKGQPLPARYPISSAADVWAVGISMLELMNLNIYGKPYMYDRKSEKPSIMPWSDDIYPLALVSLVMQCLHPEVDERIDVSALWYAIEEEVAKFDDGNEGTPSALRALKKEEILRYRPDKYALWTR